MTKSRGIRVRRGTRVNWAEQERGKHFCKCGCGEYVQVRPQHYPRVPLYLWGHNTRVEPTRPKKAVPAPQPCACGCGQMAKPGRRFLTGHNRRGQPMSDGTKQKISEKMRGERNHRHGKRPPNYIGFQTTWHGYIQVHAPHHPFGGKKGLVMEHRLIMERYLREQDPRSDWLVEIDGEKYLRPDAEIHHVDEDKTNNAITNLQVMSKADHARLHLNIHR